MPGLSKYRPFKFIIVIIAGLAVIINPSIAQDLERIDKKNPVKVTGGLNATQTFYSASGIQNRRDPYFWMLNANLNFNLFGVLDVPLSATFSQQNRSYTQPFNQYGISPRYKSVTGHFGYRSMQFSQFTLGGNIFLGAGIDIAPSTSFVKWSAMYGRFTKAVDTFATDGVISGQPAYERWGWGTKVTLGKELQKRSYDIILFNARDQATSISDAIADSFGLKPAENFVGGLVTRQAITEQLYFDIEYAMSAYTEDIRIQDSDLAKYKYANNLGPFLTTNVSTQVNKALLANLTYNAKLYQVRFSYRRIDPEYKTMGSVYLNNDIEDISGNLGWRMFKNKMNMSVGAGVQKNNLDDAQASKMNRFIGSVNWSYVVSQKLNLNATYSNFTSNTRMNYERISGNQLGLNQNIDSLRYNQITNSASAGINYNTGNQTIRHVVFTNGNYQKANDTQENNSIFYNINSGYQFGLVPQGLNVTLSATYNNSDIKEINTKSVGPNLGVSKLLFKKKIRSTLGATHLQTYSNGDLTGTNSMLRFSNSYKKGKHHTVSMDLTYLTRSVKAGTGTSFSEFRGSLIYGFTF
jgi:hypothetical protein